MRRARAGPGTQEAGCRGEIAPPGRVEPWGSERQTGRLDHGLSGRGAGGGLERKGFLRQVPCGQRFSGETCLKVQRVLK